MKKTITLSQGDGFPCFLNNFFELSFMSYIEDQLLTVSLADALSTELSCESVTIQR